MARAISTSFDQNIEQDVALEQLEGQAPAVQTTLKNAENVYKSFLYLRKMYSEFPTKETITRMSTISFIEFTAIEIPAMSNYITVNNHSDSNASIKINSAEYTLQPGEKERFPIVSPDITSVPVVSGDAVELKGTVSYIVKSIQEY